MRKSDPEFYKRVVVLSNGGVFEYGQYTLKLGNATKQHVSEIVAMIMRMHAKYNRVIQQNEILGAFCSQKMNQKLLQTEAIKNATDATVPLSPIAHYDVMTLIKAKHDKFDSYDDCTEIVCNKN